MTTNAFKFTELSSTSKEAAVKAANSHLFLEHEGSRFHLMSLDLLTNFRMGLSHIGFSYKKLSLCSTDIYGLHFSEIKKDDYLLEKIIKTNTSPNTYEKYEKTKEMLETVYILNDFSFNMEDLWSECPFQLLGPKVNISYIEPDFKFVSVMKYIIEVNSDDDITSKYKFPALLESRINRTNSNVLNEFVSEINKDLLITIKQLEKEINSAINIKLDVIKSEYLGDYADSLKEDVQYIHCKQLLSDKNSEQHQKYTFSQDGSIVFKQ